MSLHNIRSRLTVGQMIYIISAIIMLVYQLTGPIICTSTTVLSQIAGTGLILAAFFECWSSIMAVVAYQAGLSYVAHCCAGIDAEMEIVQLLHLKMIPILEAYHLFSSTA